MPDPKTAEQPVAATEDTSRRMAEMEAENKRMATELAASKATGEQSAAQATQLAERVATMESDARRKRFTDEVLGRSEAGGPRWFGETSSHVGMLEHLATSVGEEHALFTGYVTTQPALAQQMRSSNLFKEAGVSGAETSEDPQQQIVAMAEKRAAEKNISIGDAQRQIVSENPDLARRAGQSAAVRV